MALFAYILLTCCSLIYPPRTNQHNTTNQQPSCGAYRPLMLLAATVHVRFLDGDQLVYFDQALASRLSNLASSDNGGGSSSSSNSMIHDAMNKLEKTTKFALLKSLEEGISIPSGGGVLSPNVKMRE
jgi:hypothetical protein